MIGPRPRVGSLDCGVLAAAPADFTPEECAACQGRPCGEDGYSDGQFPCVEGAILVRGCCTDARCADIAPFCGMYIGMNSVCVPSDDV